MRVICSWCLQEGKVGFIDEKAPLEDERETHGICNIHQCAVRAEWRKGLRASTGTEIERAIAARTRRSP